MRAFTLVELVIVIMILGVLAGIVAPRLMRVSVEAEAAAILSNVDQIFDAAERFTAEHGRLPDNADKGDFPSDFDGYLPERLFTDLTSFGGPLDWDGPGTGSPAYGVVIDRDGGASSVWRDIYQAIDSTSDDGDKNSGWIRFETNKVRFFLADK
ncbi:MAG: prepilin-type N-terminal cleavage/methylation domain-containing protein [Planctomycetota bacterium]